MVAAGCTHARACPPRPQFVKPLATRFSLTFNMLPVHDLLLLHTMVRGLTQTWRPSSHLCVRLSVNAHWRQQAGESGRRGQPFLPLHATHCWSSLQHATIVLTHLLQVGHDNGAVEGCQSQGAGDERTCAFQDSSCGCCVLLRSRVRTGPCFNVMMWMHKVGHVVPRALPCHHTGTWHVLFRSV
jgi:hypothetical protein